MTQTFTTYLPRLDCDLTVDFDYTPRERGRRDKYGLPESPDWPAEVQCISAVDAEGNEIELTREDEDQICEQALEWADERIEDAKYQHACDKADEERKWRDRE